MPSAPPNVVDTVGMTNSENEISEINTLLDEYKVNLKEFNERIQELEEELGDAKTSESVEEIRKSTTALEQKKHLLETHIFALEIKKAEMRYAQRDNSKKNNLARNSMIASIILSVIIIVLTYFQVQTNYDLVAVGIADTLIQKDQIERRVKDLESVCERSINENSKTHYNDLNKKIQGGLDDLQRQILKIQSDTKKRIERLRKNNEVNNKLSKVT
jgi:hypothetical protein